MLLDIENLPKFLKTQRLRRGETLQEVSDATGISVSYLSDYERGRYGAGSGLGSKIMGVARYYGLEIRLSVSVNGGKGE